MKRIFTFLLLIIFVSQSYLVFSQDLPPRLTLKDLETEIALSADFKDYDEAAWEEKSQAIQVATKPTDNLPLLRDQMVAKIGRMRDQLTGNWSGMLHPSVDGITLKTSTEIMAELNDVLQQNISKQKRLMECLACTLKEIELRDAGLVRDRIVRSNYYIDYTNGIDTAAGTKQGNFTADAGTDTTTIVDAELNGLTITDNAASSGDYVWNVTRGLGSYVDSWTDATDTIVLTGAIAGQTTGDTYYIISAWKTITKYTESARTAGGGDTAYLRAGITWPQGTLAVDITFLTDGGIDLYQSIIGCDDTASGVDPWGDNSDVKPIIDFADGAYQFVITGDDFWYFNRLDIKQSADPTGAVYAQTSYGIKLENCDISDSGASSTEGLYARGSYVALDTCTFTDCWSASVYAYESAYIIMNDCIVDAGAIRGSTYALYAGLGSIIEAQDCSIAPSNTFSTREIGTSSISKICLRNCTFGIAADTLVNNMGDAIFSEDDDGTFESHYQEYYRGKITRATASPRAGGADSYAVMVPTAKCGVNSPLRLGNSMSGFARIWATKDIEINVSVYARVGTAWDGALTAAQCYATFSWLNNAVTAARTLTQSTETISNVADWTTGVHAFTSGNITPLQTGWVYIWFYVAHWEDATEEIWVDIKPVIS